MRPSRRKLSKISPLVRFLLTLLIIAGVLYFFYRR